MASGERITVTYAHPNRSSNGEPLKLDLYAFVPPVDPIDPGPTFSKQNRLPFLLFLHGGHFLTGGRRDVPAWLASLARDHHMPLICADYRLAPHAGPTDALNDLHALWRFIAEDLNWIIACSGNGAEVDSGSDMLEHDFDELQRRGGIDIDRGIIVGLGSGGYLTAMGGALLSPPPLALVMGYPLLEIGRVPSASPGYFLPASTPGHLRPLLNPDTVGRAHMAKCSVPDMPMVLDKSPYANDLRARCGMDAQERWKGKEESVRRQGLLDFLTKDNRLDALLRKASPNLILPSEVLLAGTAAATTTATPLPPRNRPYPPTLIFHGLHDTRIPADSSRRFIDVIRTAEPVAATMDALANGGFGSLAVGLGNQSSDRSVARAVGDLTGGEGDANLQGGQGSTPVSDVLIRCVPSQPNPTSRYVFLGMEGSQAEHAFDALIPRELRQPPFARNSPKIIGDRYKTSLIHVERWIQHWILEGSAERAAAQEAARQRGTTVDGDSASTGTEPITGSDGARIPLPVRPKL